MVSRCRDPANILCQAQLRGRRPALAYHEVRLLREMTSPARRLRSALQYASYISTSTTTLEVSVIATRYETVVLATTVYFERRRILPNLVAVVLCIIWLHPLADP